MDDTERDGAPAELSAPGTDVHDVALPVEGPALQHEHDQHQVHVHIAGEHAGPESTHHHSGPGHHVGATTVLPAGGHPLHHADPGTPDDSAGPRLTIVAAVAALVILVGSVTAWAFTQGQAPAAGAASTPTPTGPARPSAFPSVSTDPSVAPGAPTAAMLPASADTLVLGDSLALSVYPWLADLLPDRYVSYEAEVGRASAEAASKLERLSSVPEVVIVSSGTNDATAADVEDAATRIIAAVGPSRCVVWVDVVRPDGDYDSADEINAGIARAAAGHDNVSILRWSELIDSHPEWMSGDGIHPTQQGAQARADAFAAAAAACSPVDPDAPTAKKQFLDLSVFYGPIQGGGATAGSGQQGATPGSAPASSGGSNASASTSAAPAPAPAPSSTPTTPATTAPPTTAPPASTAPPTSADPTPSATTGAGASPAGASSSAGSG